MIGAAVGDLHLGYRAYAAVDADGRNVRERDVEKAVLSVAGRVAAADPDLVTIAGDVFHTPRVSRYADIIFREFLRMVTANGAKVVGITGNHDVPRSRDAVTPMRVAADMPDVHIIETAQAVPLLVRTGETAMVTCLPYAPFVDDAPLQLTTYEADANILLLHAPLEGDGMAWYYHAGESLNALDLAERYDIVHAGDYHAYHAFAPNCFYPGAPERTTSNVWNELGRKGWVLYDTAEQSHEQKDNLTRRAFRALDLGDLDLPPTGSAENVNAGLALLAGTKINDMVVRLEVPNFRADERGDIDESIITSIREMALHFELTLRPEPKLDASSAAADTSVSVEVQAQELWADAPNPKARELANLYLEAATAEMT